MALVKEGPDVPLFTNPGALMKLALWLGEAIKEMEKDDGKRKKRGGGATPLVLGCIDEARGVYVVVGLGGGGGASNKTDAEKQEKEKKRKDREESKAKQRAAKKEARQKARAARGEDVEDAEEAETEDESEASSDSDDSSADEAEDDTATSKKRSLGRNRFGNAFQEVVEETSARVRLDSFEHCVVEVKKEDLSGFLEGLSMKAVVG